MTGSANAAIKFYKSMTNALIAKLQRQRIVWFRLKLATRTLILWKRFNVGFLREIPKNTLLVTKNDYFGKSTFKKVAKGQETTSMKFDDWKNGNLYQDLFDRVDEEKRKRKGNGLLPKNHIFWI